MINLFSVICIVILFCVKAFELPNGRPNVEDRTFTSTVIDNIITKLTPLFKDSNIATIFSNCFPNTLDTTIANYNFKNENDLDSFVITGDIYALWLRDSQNQLQPYIPYAQQDKNLTNLIEGLIQRQAKSIIIDPFANAFNYNASSNGHQNDIRKPPMQPSIFEGKYELDSLMSFLKLSYWHYRYSTEKALKRFANDIWLTAVNKVLETVSVMQKDGGQQIDPPYKFQRLATNALDTLVMAGLGPPTKPFGLSRQLFRPSDDAVTLGYNIPGNIMACVEIKHLSEMLEVIGEDKLKGFSDQVASDICNGLDEIINKKSSDIIPYEVDGYGSSYFMDDANLPSLLSIPLLGFMSKSNQLYKKTRDYCLSSNNPYYYSGREGFGIGGPHEGPSYAWPMSLIVASMTSEDDDEILSYLNIISSTTANTGFIHEAFSVYSQFDYTRSWFAWANGLFGEMILQLIATKPQLLIKENDVSEAQALITTPISLQVQMDIN